MEVTGANPFLMEDEQTSPQSSFNPFLMEDASAFEVPEGTDNPFFSSAADPVPANNGASNPFAFDAMDYDDPPASDPFGANQSIFTTSEIFVTSAEPITTTAVTHQDLMGEDQFEINADETVLIIPTSIAPTKPTELHLENTTSISDQANEEVSEPKFPQRPPPPPRPVIPAATQDLILSVTGAMDATSSHLLDRIPPTRTPSPVSMRDLHSPSPTPDFANDLVDVGGNVEESKQEVNLFDLDDDEIPTSIAPPISSGVTTYSANTDPFGSMTQPVTSGDTTFSSMTDPFGSVAAPVSSSATTFSSNDPFGAFEADNKSTSNDPFSDNTSALTSNDPFNSFMDTAPAPAPVVPVAESTPKPLPSRPPPPIPKAAPPQKPPPPQVPPPPPSRTPVANRTPVTSPPNIATPPPKPPPPKPAPPKPPLPTYVPPVPVAARVLAPVTPPEAFPVSQPFIGTQTTTDFFSEAQPEPFAEATILETETKISPQLTGDAQTNNPFTQDETPILNTNTQTSAQFMDDFATLSSTTTTTTATVLDTNKSLFDEPQSAFGSSNNAFDAPSNAFDAPSNAYDAPSNAFDAPSNAFEPTNIFDAPTQQKTTGGFSDLFGASNSNMDILSDFNEPKPAEPIVPKLPQQSILQKFQRQSEEFDAFAAKFESAKDNAGSGFDAFGGSATVTITGGDDAWGSDAFGGETKTEGAATGFGAEEPFDSFLTLSEPPPAPQSTPARKADSDSDEDKDFAVFIKPKNLDLPGARATQDGFVPTLAPPPKSPLQSSLSDNSPRFNPFDQQQEFGAVLPEPGGTLPLESAHLERTDSQETPPTPLYDEDTSQPLEVFPRTIYTGEGWEMQLRQPNKKKITGQRFWKKIWLKLVYQGDNPVLQLYNAQNDKDPFQELPLQACYSVSEIGAQQYDQFGKIFTVKLQYVFYKERPGVRPGQVTKAERITNKLSQFAAYAIQGDYQGCKEFGSDLKKLGLPVEHAPQISQLFKIGSQTYEHMKEFSMAVEEALFRLTVHRDRALHYKMEEVQITAVDELYVEQNAEGGIDKQIARVRLFFLGFLSGMPDIELGVNDMRRQGREVVGRHDIIPVVTEEWIRLENYEFHACVQQDEYQKTHIIRFKPPDACYIELMRFRIRPPKNRELPLQLKAVMCVTGNKVELRADVLVPGFASRKLGQVPCEDVMIRFPIPECWIYLFRVEKHFRYGSVKSTHRRTGKVKGIERFLGTVETLQESLIEVTSGQAKYEHQHRAIVWRCPRLPKEGQGAYTTHNLVCRMALTSFDQIPEQLSEFAYVEFTMPATQVSHTTVRSVSVQGSDSDEPPEKYVRYLARHEYRVGIEHTKGEGPGSYLAATMTSRPAPIAEAPAPAAPAAAETSDSDSD